MWNGGLTLQFLEIEACEFVLLLRQIDYIRLIADVDKLIKHFGHDWRVAWVEGYM